MIVRAAYQSPVPDTGEKNISRDSGVKICFMSSNNGFVRIGKAMVFERYMHRSRNAFGCVGGTGDGKMLLTNHGLNLLTVKSRHWPNLNPSHQ